MPCYHRSSTYNPYVTIVHRLSLSKTTLIEPSAAPEHKSGDRYIQQDQDCKRYLDRSVARDIPCRFARADRGWQL